MFTTDAVILEGARTPMIRYMGAFDDTNALELGAVASKEAIRRAKVDANEFDHVVFGNVMQTSADALYGARHVGLKAGLPIETPAVTVNRLCGSGMESITQAAQRILLGDAKLVLAGGMENMSQCPHVIRGARTGFKLGEGKLEDSLMSGLYDTYCGFSMSETAENLAAEQGITRKAADEYSLRSQQAAEKAFQSGFFKEEIVPVEVKKGKKSVMVTDDDHRRPETTMEALESLKPAQFEGAEDKTITWQTRTSTRNMQGTPYLFHHVLPNVFFHVTTAYDILRQAGVELGKLDYLGKPQAA